MKKAHIQIIRVSAETWHLTKVSEVWRGSDNELVYEYELLGKVTSTEGLFFVDLPDWDAGAPGWTRQPRGYQLAAGAFRAVTNPKPRLSS